MNDLATKTKIERSPRPIRRRLRRFVGRAFLLAALICAIAGAWVFWRVRASMAKLDGRLVVQGLQAEVRIERDDQGVPTIQSLSRIDTAFALGFLHAQDRFFQMDLLRRLPAGRISELVGKAALSSDERFRKHRFQAIADAVVKQMPQQHVQVLDAYSRGVNQGLKNLSDLPFEYLLLGRNSEPWTNRDSVLVLIAMMCDLQPMDGDPERGLGVLQERVPQEVFQFLVRRGSRWDAAMDHSAFEEPSIPSASVWSMKHTALAESYTASQSLADTDHFLHSPSYDGEFRVGSNNWAIDKDLGKNRRAILASDMHLGLRVPTIWYRAVMRTPSIRGSDRQLVGVTLPGTPVLVEGSNGKVAWGFTNSYGDYGDIIELRMVEEKSDHYMTPDGPKLLERYSEQIDFPGGSHRVEYEWSIWGPVVETREGRKFVHHWTGDDPLAYDLNLIEMEATESVEQAMQVANRCGMPNQNVTIVDVAGDIGWTISGRIPNRNETPAITPVSGSEFQAIWNGFLPVEKYPRVYNPPGGRIWTANNRILGEDYLNTVGDGRFDPGARAMQIRDRLNEKEIFSEVDLLTIQLDDEARFMKTWRDRLNATCGVHENLLSDVAAKLLNSEELRASSDSVAYRLVQEFRTQVMYRIFGFSGARRDATPTKEQRGLAKRLGIEKGPAISYEDVARQLLDEQPEHWLPNEYQSWNELLADAARAAEKQLTRDGPLASATWGKRNRAAIKHPLSIAISWFSNLLDMPQIELPGDNHMPRVQTPSGGASQRMVVSPGEEQDGIYHQPGGQSGHPLSPYYRSGFDDWAHGKPSPLLPGPCKHTLVLSGDAK